MLGDVRKSLALILALLFVLTGGFSIALYNAEQRLFDANLYIESLERLNIYDRLPVLAAETVAISPGEDTPNSPRFFLRLLPREDWATIFRVLLPPETIQPMTEEVIRSTFSYLNGESTSITLSLSAFKANVEGDAGAESLLAVIRSQPRCSLEQIAQLTLNALFGQNTTFILCNPSDELLSLFQPLIKFQLHVIASTLPDSVDLTPGTSGTSHPLKGVREARTLMQFSPILPMGLLILITLLMVRDLNSWSAWWGYPILLSGILGLVLTIAIGPLFNWLVNLYFLARLPEFLPASVPYTIREILDVVLSGVTKPILIQSGILVFLGILIISAAPIFNRLRRQSGQ